MGGQMKNVTIDESHREELGTLIAYLINEDEKRAGQAVPEDVAGRWELFRELMITRPQLKATGEFVTPQNRFLSTLMFETDMTGLSDLEPVVELESGNIYLWEGDIVTLQIDAFVNPTTSDLLGYRDPNQDCIDNDVHVLCGVQMRQSIVETLKAAPVEPGKSVITMADNLMCAYIIHVPMLDTENDENLAAHYQDIFELAETHGCRRLACPLLGADNGVDADEAAKVAIDALKEGLSEAKILRNIVLVAKDAQEMAAYRSALGI